MIITTTFLNTYNMQTKGRGGARPGAGRKKLNKTMLHTSIDCEFLAKLKSKADADNLTIGDWLTKNLDL